MFLVFCKLQHACMHCIYDCAKGNQKSVRKHYGEAINSGHFANNEVVPFFPSHLPLLIAGKTVYHVRPPSWCNLLPKHCITLHISEHVKVTISMLCLLQNEGYDNHRICIVYSCDSWCYVLCIYIRVIWNSCHIIHGFELGWGYSCAITYVLRNISRCICMRVTKA